MLILCLSYFITPVKVKRYAVPTLSVLSLEKLVVISLEDTNRGHIYPNSIDENPDFQRTYPIEGLL